MNWKRSRTKSIFNGLPLRTIPKLFIVPWDCTIMVLTPSPVLPTSGLLLLFRIRGTRNLFLKTSLQPINHATALGFTCVVPPDALRYHLIGRPYPEGQLYGSSSSSHSPWRRSHVIRAFHPQSFSPHAPPAHGFGVSDSGPPTGRPEPSTRHVRWLSQYQAHWTKLFPLHPEIVRKVSQGILIAFDDATLSLLRYPRSCQATTKQPTSYTLCRSFRFPRL